MDQQDHRGQLANKIRAKPSAVNLNFIGSSHVITFGHKAAEQQQYEEFLASIKITKQILVTKSGTMIFIASAVLENEQIDGSQTLFDD